MSIIRYALYPEEEKKGKVDHEDQLVVEAVATQVHEGTKS